MKQVIFLIFGACALALSSSRSFASELSCIGFDGTSPSERTSFEVGTRYAKLGKWAGEDVYMKLVDSVIYVSLKRSGTATMIPFVASKGVLITRHTGGEDSLIPDDVLACDLGEK